MSCERTADGGKYKEGSEEKLLRFRRTVSEFPLPLPDSVSERFRQFVFRLKQFASFPIGAWGQEDHCPNASTVQL